MNDDAGAGHLDELSESVLAIPDAGLILVRVAGVILSVISNFCRPSFRFRQLDFEFRDSPLEVFQMVCCALKFGHRLFCMRSNVSRAAPFRHVHSGVQVFTLSL